MVFEKWPLATFINCGMSASSKYLYLLAGILLVFAWIEPNYYMPWKAFYNEFLAFLSLFLIFLADLNNKKRVSLLFICWCLFVLTLFAQMALGQFYFSSDALVAAIYIVCALISYQCGLNLEKRDVLFFISVVLLVGGGLNSVFAICQVFGVEYSFITGLSAHGRIFGNMAQPNNLSTLLCMSFLAATYLYWNQRLNVVVFVCIFLIIACVLTSVSYTHLRAPRDLSTSRMPSSA